MRYLLIIFITLSFYSSIAQITFQETIGIIYYREQLRDIIQTFEGGYVVAGATQSIGAGTHYDAYLVKLNENGTAVWGKSFGETAIDRIDCVRQTSDSGFITCGALAGQELTSGH